MSDVSPRIMRSRVFEIFLIIRRQLKSKNHISLRLQISTVFHFKIKYTTAIFMPEPQFSQHKARNQVEIFLVVFFFYVATFNTNNKCGFLTYILTHVSNFKTYDGTRDHTYKTTTRMECVCVQEGGAVLIYVTCLRVMLFLNNRFSVYFCGWRRWGGSQNQSFFEDTINVCPMQLIIKREKNFE